jgi:hypothetical protein
MALRKGFGAQTVAVLSKVAAREDRQARIGVPLEGPSGVDAALAQALAIERHRRGGVRHELLELAELMGAQPLGRPPLGFVELLAKGHQADRRRRRQGRPHNRLDRGPRRRPVCALVARYAHGPSETAWAKV